MRFRVRNVEEEYEAALSPPSVITSAASGKVERKRCSGGQERFKLKARGLPVADGTVADVSIDGKVAGSAQVQSGRIAMDLNTPDDAVPAVEAGQTVEVAGAGRVLLRGVFRAE